MAMWLTSKKRSDDDTEVVTCRKCSHLVAIKDAIQIKNRYVSTDHTRFYCREHKPPYDMYQVVAGGFIGPCFDPYMNTTHYYKTVEVDELGNVINNK